MPVGQLGGLRLRFALFAGHLCQEMAGDHHDAMPSAALKRDAELRGDLASATRLLEHFAAKRLLGRLPRFLPAAGKGVEVERVLIDQRRAALAVEQNAAGGIARAKVRVLKVKICQHEKAVCLHKRNPFFVKNPPPLPGRAGSRTRRRRARPQKKRPQSESALRPARSVPKKSSPRSPPGPQTEARRARRAFRRL